MKIAEAPKVGEMAPSTRELPFPRPDGRPCLVVFLRFCGCPCLCTLSFSLDAQARELRDKVPYADARKQSQGAPS